MKTAIELMKQARVLIAAPERYTSRFYALTAEGAFVLPSNNYAVCWDSVGALNRCSEGISYKEYNVARTALNEQMEGNSVAFQDKHSHAEVLEAWDRAIAKLDKEKE